MNRVHRLTNQFTISLTHSPRFVCSVTSNQNGNNGILDPFGHANQAMGYEMYRPRYTDELLQCVVNASTNKNMAIDLCTGTGQIAVPLSTHFKAVLGFDRSAEQLKHAPKSFQNIRFQQVTDVCQLPDTPSNCADLITIAQALHWLDVSACFQEVKRLLTKQGVLAVMGYAICRLSDPDSEKVFKDYYYNVLGSNLAPGTPGNSWAIDRRAVDNGLADYPFSATFSSVERKWFHEVKAMSVASFIGYLRTFSGYHAYMTNKAKAAVDPLLGLEKAILKAVGEKTLTVTIPYWLILCKP